MASLLSLSNELLYNICFQANCEDLRALACTNHRLSQIGKSILKKYERLWARFDTFDDGPHTALWFWHNLTCGILTTSEGAEFVRHVTTGYLEKRESGIAPTHPSRDAVLLDWDVASDSRKEVHAPPSRSLMGLTRSNSARLRLGPRVQLKELEQAVDFLPWLNTFSQRSELKAGIKSGKQQFIRALLLPALPNLRTLKIEASSSAKQEFLEIAVRHATIAHSLHQPCDSFRRLRSVDFLRRPSNERFDDVGGADYSLEFLAAFMALPKMKKIAASIVGGKTFTRPPGLPASNVTEIVFLSQDISPQAFGALLEGSSPLTKICLQIKNGPLWFDEAKFGKILLENAQDSLEELELAREDNTNRQDLIAGIQLQNFRKLRVISIHYECLRLQPGQFIGDVLPTSMKTLHIDTTRYHEGLMASMLKLLAEKEEKFPNLCELSAKCWLSPENEKELVEACNEHNVLWKPYKTPDRQPWKPFTVSIPLRTRPQLGRPS